MGKFRRRNSYYHSGPKATGNESDWEPVVDKNPFYRTMDIFNGVFRKNIKLSGGKHNATDLRTIYVNFNEKKPSPIKALIGPGRDSSHKIFLLECGHEWEGRELNEAGNAKVPGHDWGMCFVCGAEQAYRGFEHEWQHIIFKSDLAARKIFCDQYADQLLKQTPDVDKQQIVSFLSLLVNVFDDLRVNSLWERVYPGSAMAIWDRWRWYTLQMGDNVNTVFLSYIFAVAFGLPTNPQGEFEAMRPIIEWAVKKVKYRGFANMLIDVRVVLDRCMGALLAGVQPPKPKGMQPPPPPSLNVPDQPNHPSDSGAGVQASSSDATQQQQENQDGNDQEADADGNQEGQDHPQQGQQAQGGSKNQSGQGSQQAQSTSSGDPGQDSGSSSGQAIGSGQEGSQDSQDASSGLKHIPSAGDVTATEEDRTAALLRLMEDAEPLDEGEEHSEPSDEDLAAAQKSQATRLMVAKALNQDIKDLDAIDSKMPTGEPDADMQGQLDQLQSGIAAKSEASQLTDGAKARVAIIDVTTAGTPNGKATVELGAEERFFIQRMRSAFYRSLGRQKAKRAPAGNVVDVQSLIQYRGDHQDPNVFENEDINQGFAYSVLCDMSGSMHGTYPIVCTAVEMLKQALYFPFVVGNLWGFRGGSYVPGRSANGEGEVWMYRYARNVNWYTGTVPFRTHQGFNGVVQMPVECGGITPMNSAINVAATHLWRRMPTGMAKRMFLLTDGSPVQTKVTGGSLPEYMLRQFVAKEIRTARKHGVQVYTIIIGQHAIDEEKCLQMFGPRKFWRRVGADKVGTVLSQLVLANFSKYIKARG